MEFNQDQALQLACEKLMKSGATKENALPLARGIIDAENQGIKSHGFHYLPIYCLHLQIIINLVLKNMVVQKFMMGM